MNDPGIFPLLGPPAGLVEPVDGRLGRALIGLQPTALVNPGAAVRLDLPCGRYYLAGMSGSKAITIVAQSATVSARAWFEASTSMTANAQCAMYQG